MCIRDSHRTFVWITGETVVFTIAQIGIIVWRTGIVRSQMVLFHVLIFIRFGVFCRNRWNTSRDVWSYPGVV